MTNTAIPVGHPTMTLEHISPSRSAAFSPNLFHWMRTQGHSYKDGGVAENVFRILPGSRLAGVFGVGTLMIGRHYNQYEGDTDFSGALLMAVLCNGAKATRSCYSGASGSLEVVAGFWDRYMQFGRCAIDPVHEQDFVDADRYTVTGDIRTCLWCGEKHQKKMVERVVVDEFWTPL